MRIFIYNYFIGPRCGRPCHVWRGGSQTLNVFEEVIDKQARSFLAGRRTGPSNLRPQLGVPGHNFENFTLICHTWTQYPFKRCDRPLNGSLARVRKLICKPQHFKRETCDGRYLKVNNGLIAKPLRNTSFCLIFHDVSFLPIPDPLPPTLWQPMIPPAGAAPLCPCLWVFSIICCWLQHFCNFKYRDPPAAKVLRLWYIYNSSPKVMYSKAYMPRGVGGVSTTPKAGEKCIGRVEKREKQERKGEK